MFRICVIRAIARRTALSLTQRSKIDNTGTVKARELHLLSASYVRPTSKLSRCSRAGDCCSVDGGSIFKAAGSGAWLAIAVRCVNSRLRSRDSLLLSSV